MVFRIGKKEILHGNRSLTVSENRIMRKIYSFMVAAIAMFAATSCDKEQMGDTIKHQADGTMVFTAYADDANTKAALNGQQQSEWKSGDAITIHNGSTGFKFTTSANGPKATFSGSKIDGSTFMAVYPYGYYESSPNEEYTYAQIPTYQEAVKGSYHPAAALAVAYTNDDLLRFRNATTLLKFHLKRASIHSVTFSSLGDEGVSGKVKVSMGKENVVVKVEETTLDFGFEPQEGKIYLDATTEWAKDNARFAAYFFGNGNKWLDMIPTGIGDIYEVTKPEGYPNVIFCRMNPAKTENDWVNKWNQTEDITLGQNPLYKFATWDKGKEGKSTVTSSAKKTELYKHAELYAANNGTLSTTADHYYYLAVAPGTYSKGFKIELGVKDGDKYTAKSYNNSVTFKSSEIIDLGDLEFPHLYLKPNDNWKKDGARFAAYFFNDENDYVWYNMSQIGTTGIYQVEIPINKTYKNVIFCRMNGNSTTNGWTQDTQKWNQISDLVIPSDGKNLYTVKDGTWDKGGGTWSKK